MTIGSSFDGSLFRKARGFTLIVTLAILAAVTILVVGLFGILTRERQVSATYDAVDQADLAVQAGLERAGAMLKQALADDQGVIFAAPLTPEKDAHGRGREMLLSARYDPTPEKRSWSYQPLVSGVASPPDTTEQLVMPDQGFEMAPSPLVKDASRHYLDPLKEGARLPRAAPWRAAKPKFWLEVRLPDVKSADGSEERLVGRYCFEVEDVQARLSLASAGFHDSHPDRDSPMRLVEGEEVDVPQNPPLTPPGILVDEGGRWRRQSSMLWTLLEPGWEWLPEALNDDLWPFEPKQSLVSSKAMHRLLASLDSKRLYFSPDSWRELLMAPNVLADWRGMQPEAFADRYQAGAELPPGMSAGSLKHSQLRALEENTTGAWAAYDELALIPHGAGLEFSGEPKLNLNSLVVEADAHTDTTDTTKARVVVEKIADHIDRHLPDFRKRAGGYPLPRSKPLSDRESHEKAYLKNLAAGMIDYVDLDSTPTGNIDQGGAGEQAKEADIEYRGMDSFPLVNEYWQRYRYERLVSPSKVDYSLTDYAELWNMTNQEVSGEVLFGFEYRGRMWVGSEVYPVMTTARGNRVVSGKPLDLKSQEGLDGLWLKPEAQLYYPPEDMPDNVPQPPANAVGTWVHLRPNEITVLRCPPVVFRLDGSGIETITGVQYYGQPAHGNDEHESRYRMAFRPKGASKFTIVDMPFNTLERYQMSATASFRQRFNVNQCGLSYRLRDKNWAFNVGDTRAAYYIDYHQEVIDYDDGSSPWGRNFRRFENLAGESRTFLWPDGGHNSEPAPDRINDINLNPVDPNLSLAAKTRPAIRAGNSAAERHKYVQQLSSRGRYFSPTELGHVFDPVMWNPNGTRWEDEPVIYGQHADIKPEVFNTDPSSAQLDAHKRFCGGNTLRIGRVEHSAFRPDYRPDGERDSSRREDRGLAASTLLDLFHCGDPNAINVEAASGNLTRIDGHINVNTATRDVLRSVIAGRLRADPLLTPDSEKDPKRPTRSLPFAEQGRGNEDLDEPKVMIPASSDPELMHADLVAEAIIRNRPYASPAEVAEKAVINESMRDEFDRYEALSQEQKSLLLPLAMDQPVFGYTKRTTSGEVSNEEDRRVQPQWNDRGAEELFSRLWNNSTARSRHFQITVTGQAVRKSRSGEETVQATRTRLFQVFIRPVRDAAGVLTHQVVEITHSRTL